MPLTIPNSADAAFGAQSEPDSRDFDAIVAAMGGTCVLAGCAVTAQAVPNMTVAVAAGTIASSATVASVTGGNVTIAANASGNPRFDLIVATAAGALAARQGTAAINPTFPSLTAGDVMLAAVWVPNGAASIATNQIVDKRALTDYPTAAPVALSAAANSGSALTLSLSDHVHPSTGLGVLASANTWTLTNTFSTSVVSPFFMADVANAVIADLQFRTSGVARWVLRKESTTESGSNAGSNMQFMARDDAGALLFTIWSITRSTGVTLYGKQITEQWDGTVGNNPFVWQHTNTAYRGSLGVYSGAGHPFVGLHAEHSATANQMRNDGSGSRGAIISADQVSTDAVSIVMGDTTVANTTWTTPVTLATFFYNAGVPLLQVNPGLAVGVSVAGAASGSPARVVAIGTDTNIVLGLNAKGTGSSDLNVAASTGTGGVRVGDGAGNVKAQINSSGMMTLATASAPTDFILRLASSGLHPNPGAATIIYGIGTDFAVPSNATANVYANYARLRTLSAFTLNQYFGYYVEVPSVFASGVVNAIYGMYVTNQGSTGVGVSYGLLVAAQSGSTHAVGARIDSAAENTLLITADTTATTAAQGITFSSGKDVSLFRTAIGTLRITDAVDTTHAGMLQVDGGSAASVGFEYYQAGTRVWVNRTPGTTDLVWETNTTKVAGLTQAGLFSVGTGTGSFQVSATGVTGVGGAAAGTAMVEVLGAHASAGPSTYGVNVHPTFSSLTTTEINGFRVQMTTPATVYTVATAVALRVVSTSLGLGSIITNNYGIWVEPRTVGTNDYGVRIDSAQTQTLWVSADVQPTTAAQGIGFGGSGSAPDTNLYRGGVAILQTDAQTLKVLNTGTTAANIVANQRARFGWDGAGSVFIDDVATNKGFFIKLNSVQVLNITAAGLFSVGAGAGTFQVLATGQVGVGTAAVTTSALVMSTHPGSGTQLYGVDADVLFPAGTTSAGASVHARLRTSAAYTMVGGYGLLVDGPVVAAGFVTNMYGVFVSNQAQSGVVNAVGILVNQQTGTSTAVAARFGGGDTANLHLQSDTASAAGGIAFGATISAGQSMYRQALNVLEVGGTFSAVTGFQVNHAVATAGHYLRGDGTRFVDGIIAAGDLPSSGIANVAYLNAANQFTLVNTFTAANSTVLRAMSGASGSWAAVGIGRTALESYFGISRSAGTWFTGDAAGDAALQLTAGVLHLGVGTASNYAQLQVDTSKVLVPVQMVLGTNAGTMHYYPHVVSYDSQASVTGAIIITTPLLWNTNQMTTLYVRGYIYDRQVNINFIVSFYPYSGGSVSADPINITCTDLGSDGLVKRIGVDAGGHIAVSIGDIGTVNYFAHVIVDAEITQSNTTFPTGWSVSTTTTAGFGWTATNLLTSNTTTTGNITINQIGTGGTQANGYIHMVGTTLNGTYLRYTEATQLFTIEDNSPTARVTVNLGSGDTTFARYVTAAGFQVSGAAATGQYLRGDGTKAIFSALLAGDMPTSGIPNVAYLNVANTFTQVQTIAVTPGAGLAHLMFGVVTAASGSPSAKLTFQGAGVDHAGMYWTPNSTTGNGTLILSHGGSADPAANTTMATHFGDGRLTIPGAFTATTGTFTIASARAVTVRSGASASWAGIDIGRTGTEVDLAVATVAGSTFFSGDVAGDGIVRVVDNTKALRMGVGTNVNVAQVIVQNALVTVNTPVTQSGATYTITAAASNNPYYMLSDGTSIMKIQMIGTTYGWTGTQSNHPYVLGTNNAERVRILTSGIMQAEYGITNTPAYAAGTIQEHFLGYANAAPTSWAMSLAYLGDASYVNHMLTLNGRITGGTRAAPTFTSGGGTGGVVLMYDPSAALFTMATINGTGVAPKSGLSMEPINGYVGIGATASSSYSLLVSTNLSSAVGLVVRAVTSQSVDLQRWEGPAGSPLYGEVDNAGVLRQYGPATTTNEYAARVTGDTQDRWLQTADGSMKWGPGNAATDTTLARVAVGVLQLSGEFNIVGQSSIVTILVQRAPSGMAADLTQYQDSSSNVLSRVDGQGYGMFKNFDEKSEFGIHANPAAATFFTSGSALALTTTGTLGLSASTLAAMVTCTTGAVSGNTSGVRTTSFSWFATSYEPEFHARVLTSADIANIRIWVAMTTVDMSAVGVATTQQVLGFRFDTGVPDTKWQCISGDGTSAAGTDSGVTVAANTSYTFSIVRNMNASNEWRFYINGNLVATKTANVPANGTTMGLQVSVTTLAALAKTLHVAHCRLRYN